MPESERPLIEPTYRESAIARLLRAIEQGERTLCCAARWRIEGGHVTADFLLSEERARRTVAEGALMLARLMSGEPIHE